MLTKEQALREIEMLSRDVNEKYGLNTRAGCGAMLYDKRWQYMRFQDGRYFISGDNGVMVNGEKPFFYEVKYNDDAISFACIAEVYEFYGLEFKTCRI